MAAFFVSWKIGLNNAIIKAVNVNKTNEGIKISENGTSATLWENNDSTGNNAHKNGCKMNCLFMTFARYAA